jgi:hypothetical protein
MLEEVQMQFRIIQILRGTAHIYIFIVELLRSTEKKGKL